MDEQKALEFLKNNEEKKTAGRYIHVKAAAIKALEKQIPKKVIEEKGETFALSKDGKESYVLRHRCPSCNRIIRMFEANRFCMFCGQAIDWSEDPERKRNFMNRFTKSEV